MGGRAGGGAWVLELALFLWPMLGSGRSVCQGAEVWGARPQKSTPTVRTTISWYFSSFTGHDHKEIRKGEKSITLGTTSQPKKEYEIRSISENILH